MSEYSEQDIYNEFIQRAQNDFNMVSEKIEKCFSELKEAINHKYELKLKIKECCRQELEDFHNNWFLKTCEQLKGNSLLYYRAGYETMLMYSKLLNFISDISQDSYDE